MVKMIIEFFHNVPCSWCYVFSPRMHQLAENHPEVELFHGCFALAPTPESLTEIFGSKERGKKEILNHWRHSNERDDLHRLRPDLIARRDFDYPHSLPSLKACKAAEMQGGQKAHWKMFDRVQKAHFTECRNIANDKVLRDCARDAGLDVEQWNEDFLSEDCERWVYQDMKMALRYDVTTGVPTLIAQGKYKLVGVHEIDTLETWLNKVKELVR